MKRIDLGKGRFALVDDADYEPLSKWKWSAKRSHKSWYAYRMATVWCKESKTIVRRTWISMHRQILGIVGDSEKEIDHRDLNGLNNQRANLRVCSDRENSCNRSKRRGCKFAFKGVFQNRQGRFTATICIERGKRKSVGTFLTLEEAARAYDEAAKFYYGAFAKLNFN